MEGGMIKITQDPLNQALDAPNCFFLLLSSITAEAGGNSVLGVNLYLIWTWRLHNRIASALAELNPCWDDERLFFQTREIVIAIYMQIYYYELMPVLMGKTLLLWMRMNG